MTLQSWNVPTDLWGDRDVQRGRAAQVGLLMRSYRESFSSGGGRRGLTQEALLESMGSMDSDYAERYSHATVSRWESGGTRPLFSGLKVFRQSPQLIADRRWPVSFFWQGSRLTLERHWVTSPGVMVVGQLVRAQRLTGRLPPT